MLTFYMKTSGCCMTVKVWKSTVVQWWNSLVGRCWWWCLYSLNNPDISSISLWTAGYASMRVRVFHSRFRPVKLNMPICWVMWSQVPGVPRPCSLAFSWSLINRTRSAMVFTLPFLQERSREGEKREWDKWGRKKDARREMRKTMTKLRSVWSWLSSRDKLSSLWFSQSCQQRLKYFFKNL